MRAGLDAHSLTHAVRGGQQHHERSQCALRQGEERGFTLLELLLALTVAATIAAALSTTLYTAFRARTSAERAIQAARSLEAIGEIVAEDLSTAMPPTGLLASSFLGDSSSVDFYCSGPEYGAAVTGGARRVQYAMGDSTGAEAQSLVRRATANLLAPVEVEAPEERICGGVSELKFEYCDGSSWVDSWDSTQHNDTLPVAVRVTVSLLSATADNEGTSVSRLITLPCGVSADTLADQTAGGTQ